ncbi:ABC transporter permease [Paracidobacterium acidisoli]|uniref:ABC transporter substrate-binding protein n=1 Tax=Paracidobacterium acidisoli TaxID=2303751 RepID=A0A372IPQ9_9BACT|nr:ABC transporter permease [Paracidobacterium acidisoli]MBT9331217.1 ABC transporter permease [Paracidobacterium acidisoli]
MAGFLHDLRHALRQMRKAPAFTLTVVITLALGIGANTAIFTLVNAVMLSNLPSVDPQNLYQIGDNDKCCQWGGFQDDWAEYSYDFYRQMRDNTPGVESMAAFSANTMPIAVRRGGTTVPAAPMGGEFVSGNYFSTLGVRAFTGRMMSPGDDTDSAAPVAVLSYRAWQQKYGMDASILGGTLLIDGRPFTVIGVTPPAFYGDRLRSDPPDLYLPIHQESVMSATTPLIHLPDESWLYAIGRLKPGASPEVVSQQLTAELQHWLPTHVPMIGNRQHDLPKQHIILGPGGAGITHMRRSFRSGLMLLVGASALVLLIACANLANLLLARSTARRQQAALQLALGASRKRLVRGTLAESILLSLIGGAAGLVLAYVGTKAILLVIFRGATTVPIDPSPSLAVLAFAFLLSLITGVLFGVAPALISSRTNPADALRGASRSIRDASSLPQKSLVVFQAAFSLVLLAVAGLVTQSLSHMQGGGFGFEPEGRLVVAVDPESAGYKVDQLPQLYREMEDRLNAVPGVRSAALSLYSPLDGDNWNDEVAIEGHPVPAGVHQDVTWVRVSPKYFDTIGTALMRGRVITDADTATSERVAVIDEAFARKYLPGRNPIGERFGWGYLAGHEGDFTIVGVVKTTRYLHPLQTQPPMFFLPLTQSVTYQQSLMQWVENDSHYIHRIELLVNGSPLSYVPVVRSTLASINPDLTVISTQTMDEQIAQQFNQQRLTARLTGLFGILALLLASIGLYGVTAYNVARRTGEIGIRMALGADRGRVVSMVMRGAFAQIAIGLAIGLPLALIAGIFLAHQLYEVPRFDPLVLLAALVVLTFSAAIAAILPARRAASIEPVQALRTE